MKKLGMILFALALAGGCSKDEKGGGGAGDCDKLGGKVEEMGKKEGAPAEMVKMMADVMVTSCKEDKWPKEAVDCALKAKDLDECEGKLSPELEKKVEDRMKKAMGLGDEPPAGGDTPPAGDEAGGAGGAAAGAAGTGAAAAGGSGLAECDEYVAAVDKYMACDKVPQSARDAAKQGIDAMKSSWANMGSMPEEAKKAAADACKQGVDALKQGAQAMGCEI